jgi:toxin secretion/phage lysis holin
MKSFNRKDIRGVVITTFSNASFKTSVGVLLTVYSFLFDPLKTQLYYAIAMLIVFDFITALISALKNKVPISSREASRTLVKLFLYGMMVSAATLVDRFVVGFAQLFSDLTMAFIAITEFISILENMRKYGIQVPTGIIARLKLLQKEETIDQINISTEKIHDKIDAEAEKIKNTII